MSVNEAANQGVPCQELDCFAHVFNRREGRGWVAFGNEFKYPLESVAARGLSWTAAMSWHAGAWRLRPLL